MEKVCNDPAEPRSERAVVACGITSACKLPDGTTIAVDAPRLALAQKVILYWRQGYPLTSTRCKKMGTYRYACRGRLTSVYPYPYPYPVSKGFVCLSVVARGRVLSFKPVELWQDSDITDSPTPSDPYKPRCAA
jgi:hypothetical protein